jgi:hypothetical protein
MDGRENDMDFLGKYALNAFVTVVEANKRGSAKLARVIRDSSGKKALYVLDDGVVYMPGVHDKVSKCRLCRKY